MAMLLLLLLLLIGPSFNGPADRTAESFALRLAQFRASSEELTQGCPEE